MRVDRRWLSGLVLVASLWLLTACGSAIGDSCGNNQDCPTSSYCDLTMPGGLCTIQDCREGDCPDGSVCVTFENESSYCMARCDSDGDCRGDYTCVKDLGPWPFCSYVTQ